MSGEEEELTFRVPRRPAPGPAGEGEPGDEPTQVDNATRLAARGLDSTRLASRGPAREREDRISAPVFSGERPELRPDPPPGPDRYAPRTAAPAASRPSTGGTAVTRGNGDRPDPAAPRIVTPAQRRERDRADRRRRTLRGAGIAGAALAALAAAAAIAIALL